MMISKLENPQHFGLHHNDMAAMPLIAIVQAAQFTKTQDRQDRLTKDNASELTRLKPLWPTMQSKLIGPPYPDHRYPEVLHHRIVAVVHFDDPGHTGALS